jgi:DNA-binding transcriptional regulator YiaG
MTEDTLGSALLLGYGTTSADGNYRSSFQKTAPAAISGALVLCFFGTSSVSALPKPSQQIIVSGSTHSSGLYARVHQSEVVAGSTNQIREFHRRSGLSWENIARTFRVDRRTVHLWASGRPMRAIQAEKLGRIMSVLPKLDRGSPSATRDFLLMTSIEGKLLVEYIEEGRFTEIAAATLVPARANRWTQTRRPPRLPVDTAKARRDLPLPELLGGEDNEV